jgi:hypothetical protein
MSAGAWTVAVAQPATSHAIAALDASQLYRRFMAAVR